jgi:peptidoglycan/xylan/chitin deacetylase (PgdA/CDA1 family)
MQMNFLAAAANHTGFLDAYAFMRRKVTKSQIAIIIYHRVYPKRDSWSLESLSPESFQKQIEYFCRGYEVLSLERLAQGLKQGSGLPAKGVVITFDDGYRDNYVYAYPVIKKFHVPVTIFLTTGHIGSGDLFWWDKVTYAIHHTGATNLHLDKLGNYPTRNGFDKAQSSFLIVERLKHLPEETKQIWIEKLLKICGATIPGNLGKELILSWEQIKEMSSDAVSFGAHSVSHPILTNISIEQAKWEIRQSKKDVEEKLGKPVMSFSYPNGNFNSGISQFVRGSGFTSAVSVLPNDLINRRDDPYELSRISGDEDFNKFKVVFGGLWGDLHIIMGRSVKAKAGKESS